MVTTIIITAFIPYSRSSTRATTRSNNNYPRRPLKYVTRKILYFIIMVAISYTKILFKPFATTNSKDIGLIPLDSFGIKTNIVTRNTDR